MTLNTLYYVVVGIVGLIGLLFVATLLPIPGNVEVKVVKSGSMEPAIGVGSVVVIKPSATYEVGDIITFGADTKTQIPTTHRIIAKEGEGASATYTTKGDANDSEDNATTPFAAIRGKMLFTVPFVGYALAFARTPLGFFLLVGVPALLVFLEEGRSIYKEVRKARLARRRKLHTEGEEIVEVVPRQPKGDINRKKVMGAFAVLLGLGVVSASGYFGSTVAYYANSATSYGNSMRAGEFTIPEVVGLVLGAFEVAATELVADMPDAPKEGDEPTTRPEPEGVEETPPEDIPEPPQPEVEVSEPVVVEAVEPEVIEE